LCTSGLELEGKNKEQSVVKLTLEAVAENAGNLDTIPVKIYYPVVTEHSGIIPDEGVYYVMPDVSDVGDYSTATAVYMAGDAFPETPSQYDCYVFGDYEYRYECNYKKTKSGESGWLTDSNMVTGAWGVRVLDETKTEYGEILDYIQNAPVSCLNCTFAHCASMLKMPYLPKETVNARYVCNGCLALGDVTGIIIPATVTNMFGSFQNCVAMTGRIVVDANPTEVTYCFSSTEQPIFLTGASTLETKKALAETSANGNVTYENTAEPIAYSYNGTVLPPLPEWDKTAYPYAVLDGNLDFYASSAPMTSNVGFFETVTYVAPYLYADFSTADMAFKDLESRQTDGTSRDGVCWSNHTVLDNNGNVRCEASDPIPVILPLTLFDGEVTTEGSIIASATIDIVSGYKVGDKLRITFNGVTADYIARKEDTDRWQFVGNGVLDGSDDGVDDGGDFLLTYPHISFDKFKSYFYTRTAGTYNLKIELIESEVT
jgi:hypothetical protein